MRGELIAVCFWILLAVKWLQKNILDPMLERILGYSTRDGKSGEKKSREYYENSAQRVKVWARAAYSPASIHSPANFLYTHLNYCHPNEVLKWDNITLQVSHQAG